MHGGHRDLARLVGGTALDGRGHDLTRRLISLGTHALLALSQDLCLLAHGVGAHTLDELPVCLLLGERCNALELGGLPGIEAIDLALAPVYLALHAGKLVLLAIQRVIATVE